MSVSSGKITFESPDGKSAVTYDDRGDPQAQAAALVHRIGYQWGEQSVSWPSALTGAIIGLILGIVLTLAFFPGWAC